MVVHSTLKQAKPQAPCQARRRRTGSSARRRRDDPTRFRSSGGPGALGGERPPQDEAKTP
jgi:hypothetical protein